MRSEPCFWSAAQSAVYVARSKWWMKSRAKNHHDATSMRATGIHILTGTATVTRILTRAAEADMAIVGVAVAAVSAGVVVANVAGLTADTSFYTLQHGV